MSTDDIMLKTMELEIDGEMKDVQIFAGMWEYIQHYGSDITHYRVTREYAGEKIIKAFRPIEDTTFSTHSCDMVDINGKMYQRVWWGESETNLIPEADLMAQFWTVYEWGGTQYECTGRIFQTEKEAQVEILGEMGVKR